MDTAQPAAEPLMRTPCIAVIAADGAALDTTKRLLALDGYQAMCFGTAAAAAAPIRQRRPALVIVDLQWQRVAGWALVVALQQDPTTAHIPIVVWSADVQVSTTVAGWPGTSVLVQDKPVRPYGLLALVADLALVR